MKIHNYLHNLSKGDKAFRITILVILFGLMAYAISIKDYGYLTFIVLTIMLLGFALFVDYQIFKD
jgi:hypothetical protein